MDGHYQMYYLPCNTIFYYLTLTYNPRLAKVKVDLHAKNQG